MSSPELSVVSLRPNHKPPESTSSDTPPETPEWLTDIGKQTWARLAPLFNLTPADIDEFAAYCEAIAEYQESTVIIAEAGLLIIDPASGMPIPNPIQAVRDRADRKLAFWAGRFRGA